MVQAVEAVPFRGQVIAVLAGRADVLTFLGAADTAGDPRVTSLALARLVVVELLWVRARIAHVFSAAYLRKQVSILHRHRKREIILQVADPLARSAPRKVV